MQTTFGTQHRLARPRSTHFCVMPKGSQPSGTTDAEPIWHIVHLMHGSRPPLRTAGPTMPRDQPLAGRRLQRLRQQHQHQQSHQQAIGRLLQVEPHPRLNDFLHPLHLTYEFGEMTTRHSQRRIRRSLKSAKWSFWAQSAAVEDGMTMKQVMRASCAPEAKVLLRSSLISHPIL